MGTYRNLLVTGCLMLVFLAGCSQHVPARQGDTYNDIQSSLDQAVQSNTDEQLKVNTVPPSEITAALMAAPMKARDLAKNEPRFDIAIGRASARDFFMGLAEGADYNMIVHPDVSGEISLTLRNVTIHDVMQAVQRVYGYEYDYVEQTQSIYVLPIRLQSRIFQINYLNMRRRGKSETRVSSGEVTQTPLGSSSAGGGTSTETLTSSEILSESDTDLWGELTRALATIIGTEGGRSVSVNPHTGLVVVRAMPGELREVERFLAATQTNLQRQVILEAKIIEVQLNDQYQAGINWASIFKGSGGKYIVAGQTGGGSIFSGSGSLQDNVLGTAIPGFPATTAGNTFTLQPSAVAAALGSSAFGGVFSLALNLNDFVGFIELLESQGTVQVLSSPRIATINNQKAIIKVGTDEFFITDIQSNTSSGATSNISSTNVTFTPFFSGISLDVTPQIDDQGIVTLHVHPKISEVSPSIRSIPLADGSTQQIELARSTVRESDTIVRARSGQVVVIGGLMKNFSSERNAATPVLGDLPIIGSAFRHTQQGARKSELVILLRPLVVDDSGAAWQQTLIKSRETIKSLYQGPGYTGKSGGPGGAQSIGGNKPAGERYQ